MSGSRPKHSSKAFYPGASQQLSAKRTVNIVSQPNLNNEGSPLETRNQKANFNLRDQDNSLKQSFELSWVENYPRSGTFHGKQRTESKNLRHNSSDKISSTAYQNTFQPPTVQNISDLRGRMQSNRIIQPDFSTGSQYSESGQTALDMSHDLLNESQATTSLIDDPALDGQLTDGSPEVGRSLSEDYNQLDEPILETLVRDLTGIYNKIKIIALPLSSYEIYKIVLRGWDLWGPLMLCTFLAFNLHHPDNIGPHFADIFVLVWFGSCIVSLNYRLLSLSSGNNQVLANQQASHLAQANQFQDVNSGDTMSAKENLGELGERAHMSSGGAEKAAFQTLMSPPSMFQLMCVFGYCLVAPCFGLILLKVFPFSRLFFERMIIGLLFGFAWPTFCSVRILIRYQHPEKRVLAIYPIGLFYFVLSCLIISNH